MNAASTSSCHGYPSRAVWLATLLQQIRSRKSERPEELAVDRRNALLGEFLEVSTKRKRAANVH